MLHEPCWSEHLQCQVYFSRNMNSSLPAPLTGSEERCSALKDPAAAGLDQKFWCKQNLHRLYLWFFSAIRYSVAWFSSRSCILFWLSSLDGKIPRANSKCISCGLNRAFIFKLDSIPTLWCMLESIVLNMQELIQNLLPLLSSALKWAFRGVPLGQSATSCPVGGLLATCCWVSLEAASLLITLSACLFCGFYI